MQASNPANFGLKKYCLRECICEVEGQVPCPSKVPLPKEMTGKYRAQMAESKQDWEVDVCSLIGQCYGCFYIFVFLRWTLVDRLELGSKAGGTHQKQEEPINTTSLCKCPLRLLISRTLTLFADVSRGVYCSFFNLSITKVQILNSIKTQWSPTCRQRENYLDPSLIFTLMFNKAYKINKIHQIKVPVLYVSGIKSTWIQPNKIKQAVTDRWVYFFHTKYCPT